MKQFILVILLLVVSTAFAQNKAQKDLIKKNQRPLPEVIMANPELMKEMEDFSSNNLNSEYYKEALAKVIVSLEKTFPGGTYAFLGRDTDLLADAVDAFYVSIGQKGRVARIRFSSGSRYKNDRYGNEVSYTAVAKFLETSGLNLNPKPHKGGEYVLVDYTSYSGSSQSNFIIDSAVKYMKQDLKLSDAEILKRLNVATLNSSPTPDVFSGIESRANVASFKKTQLTGFKVDGTLGIIALAGDSDSRNLAYSNAWHETYGPIRKNSKGVYSTRPTEYFEFDDKARVLAEIIEAIKIAKSRDFKEKVAKLAVKNRVDFKAGRKIAKCNVVSGR